MEDKRGQEGHYVELGRFPFEDRSRSGGVGVLGGIKQGQGLDAVPQSPLPANSRIKQI
ncbi:MAG: hypothetical protein OXC26_10110 [Albidovulum sp.]|nr:hypothetical protein [Albidovulum sp.]